MIKISKRRKKILENLGENRFELVPISTALAKVKEFANTKFNESVDIALNLGIDPRKSEQSVRGATVLPHGTGKTLRVAVFTQGDNAKKAKEAGADIVGLEDLAELVKKGQMDFDVVVATPDAMRIVGQLGQILGPRGLMPNPKVGTVTADVVTAVKNAKAGQVQYRIDKNGIIHASVGKANFSVEQLQQNIEALVADIKKAKPPQAKGTYLKKLVISSTMGPGLRVDISTLNV